MCLCNALPAVPRSPRASRVQAPGVQLLAVEIAGTWDFKWPLGTQIRIAFQRPRGLGKSEFARGKSRVEEYARLWSALLSESACDLSLRFTGLELDPPLGPEHSTTDQHRSSFAPTQPSQHPYDVLISLDDLPITRVDPFQSYGARLEPIDFPISELGSYARRLDYGVPTLYLGRFAGARKLYGDDFQEYFDSPLAQNIVVHELGHMLGLPHLHQHPRLLANRASHYASARKIQDDLAVLLSESPSVELVERNVLVAWPGNYEFSDWPELSSEDVERHAKNSELDSIMTHPYYRFFAQSAGQVPAQSAIRELEVRCEPGALDRAMLKRMYA